MQELRSFLDLPLATLAVLAGGYLGYRLAYIGRDKSHRPIDVLFISLAFAFITKLSAELIDDWVGKSLSLVIGVALSIAAAALWRAVGTDQAFKLLRATRISSSDHHVSAWDSVRLKRGFNPNILTVLTTDGERLMCHKPEVYGHLRDGPCILGEDGSVAMFVTDRCAAGQTEWIEREVFDPKMGYEMTYIPAGRIAEIRFHTLT